MRDVEEIVAYVTADKYREMDEAVDRAFAQYGRILGTTVSEARAKFEAESAEDRKRVVEEAVSAVRERHDSELRKAIDRSMAEEEEAAAARPDRGAAYSGSGGGEN